MSPKARRMRFVLIALAMLFTAAGLILYALDDNLVYFYSPTDVQEKHIAPDTRIRIGGLVEEGSVVRKGNDVSFRVTDLSNSIPVRFTGALPDLFREGQGVVTEGRLTEDGVFIASEVLAKHDEKYMPPEVADALKRSGQWQGGGKGGS